VSIWWIVAAFMLGFSAGLITLALMNIAASGDREMVTTANEAREPRGLDPLGPDGYVGSKDA
jgi:hypothetical protein